MQLASHPQRRPTDASWAPAGLHPVPLHLANQPQASVRHSHRLAAAAAAAAAQSSAVQYSTVQCSAVQCSAVQCSAVQYSAVQYSTVQCSTVQCSAVQCSAAQSSAEQCSAVQCSAVLCSAVHHRCMTGQDRELLSPWLLCQPVHVALCTKAENNHGHTDHTATDIQTSTSSPLLLLLLLPISSLPSVCGTSSLSMNLWM